MSQILWRFIEMSHNVDIGLKKCIRIPHDITIQLEETVVWKDTAPCRSLPEILQWHQGSSLLDSCVRKQRFPVATAMRREDNTNRTFFELMATRGTTNREAVLTNAAKVSAMMFDYWSCKNSFQPSMSETVFLTYCCKLIDAQQSRPL